MENLILSLPSHIITDVIGYLPLADIKSFRLTCLMFYKLCFCKEALQKVHLKPKFITSKFKNFLENLFQGKFVRLSLQLIDSPVKITNVLQTFSNITDLSIRIAHLGAAISSCKHLIKLVLLDAGLDSVTAKDEVCYLPLKSLDHLIDLTVHGCNQLYSTEIINFISKNAKKLVKLSFISITFKTPTNRSHKEIAMDIFTADHVKHWYFKNVTFLSFKFKLPVSVLSLTCIDSPNSPLDERHSSIESISIDGMVPYLNRFWKKNNFVRLKKLELKRAYFYHTPLSYCYSLKMIKINDCYKSVKFITSLSSAVEQSLQYLFVKADNAFDNKTVIKVLNKFPNLEELAIIGYNDITLDLVFEITHSKLRVIYLKHCEKFNFLKCNSIQNLLTFRVEKNFKDDVL